MKTNWIETHQCRRPGLRNDFEQRAALYNLPLLRFYR